MNILQTLKRRTVKFDWKAYFREFCVLHGEPVPYGGQLLFPDGYMYSRTDYSGPERRPPDDADEQLKLDTAYWLVRRRMVLDEAAAVRQELLDLRAASAARSVPLQCITAAIDEHGKYYETSAELDLVPLVERLADLETELRNCDGELSVCQRR